MMHNVMKTVLAVLAISILSLSGGCGGSSTITTVSGTASKGLLYPGSVNIFAVDAAGAKATSPLATVATDSSGKFSANIGTYSGTIVLEATGTYTDEAKGISVVIDSARPMKAAVGDISSGVARTVAVTPLTDLACSLAGTLTAANITAANARISSLFKIADITTVEPVQPSAAVMLQASPGQQTYTLALATISQMAKAANPSAAAAFSQIASILTAIKADLDLSTTAGMGTVNKNAFNAALNVVTSGSLSGFSTAAANLGAAGTRTLSLTLATSGVPSGKLVGAVQASITLPAGASLRFDPVVSGLYPSVLSSLFVLNGNIGMLQNGVNGQVMTFGITSSGFAGGDFATLVVDISSGTPTAADFVLSGITILDNSNNPATIPGATVTVH